jgi:integrase
MQDAPERVSASVQIAAFVSPHLRKQLLALYLNDRPGDPEDFVFPTRSGRADNRNNVRRRLIVKAVEQANTKLAELGIEPIGRLSPHGLRHSYASLRSACGYPLASTTKQIGHTDVRFTQNVYTHAPEHAERLEGVAREHYEKALDWAGMGSNELEAAELAPKVGTENPA